MEDRSCYEDLQKSNGMTQVSFDFAKSGLFYVQEVGTQCLLSSCTNKSEKDPSYLFFIVTGGQGTLEYEGISYVISGKCCVFLDCSKPYSYYACEGALYLNYIYFNGFGMKNIYGEYRNQGGGPCFCIKRQNSYVIALEQIQDILRSDSSMKDLEIDTRLTIFLTQLMNEGKNVAVPARSISQKQNLQNIKAYLEQHYQERISLDHLSETFYINKYYLTKLFRKEFGMSITSYLIQVRLAHAKNLLLFSNMSVEAIGHECGIGNANYFTKVFKKMEGMPPGEFRKKEKTKL